MADLVVVSNRGPLSFRLEDGEPVPAGTAGGLAGTLNRLLAGTDATWVAAAMGEADRRAAAAGMMQMEGLRIVVLDPGDDIYRMAYDVVSNATLWFCHHHLFDLPRRPRTDRRWREAWDAYRAYNRQFADTVAREAAPGAPVLVQDYHLSLVGGMLAADRPDLRTVHFSHTPFADPNMLRCLPDDAAGELCPVWPGHPVTAHWGVPDPARATGSDIERLAVFWQAFRMLETRVKLFASLPFDKLQRAALTRRVEEIGRVGVTGTEGSAA